MTLAVRAPTGEFHPPSPELRQAVTDLGNRDRTWQPLKLKLDH